LSGAVAEIFAGRQSEAEEALARENAQLKHEKEELSNVMQRFKRQSDVERAHFAELEGTLQREREMRAKAEKQLKNEEIEKSSLISEAQSLREQLEITRSAAEAQRQAALQEQRQTYEEQLQRKEEELRETRRKSELHSRQLEELQRSAQKSDRGGDRELQPEEQAAAEPCDDEPGTVMMRRRLFSTSTGGCGTTPGGGIAATMSAPALEAEPKTSSTRRSVTPPRTHGHPAPFQFLPPATTPSGVGPRPSPAATVGCCAAPRWGSAGAGGTPVPAVSPRIAAVQETLLTRSAGSLPGTSSPHVQREHRRSGSQAPGGAGSAPSSASAAPPVAMVMHSAAALPPGRECNSPVREEEEPPAGCVLAAVSMFEQRCQTPRRDGGSTAGTPSGARGGGGAGSRAPSSGEERGSPAALTRYRLSQQDRSTRPVPRDLPKAPFAALAPKALTVTRLSATEADASGGRAARGSREQVFMGMSPIGASSRDLLESLPASSAASTASFLKVPCSEPLLQKCGSVGSAVSGASGGGGESTPPKLRALRRESSIPEVSVQERIRTLQLF
jgi:hypothetical protein